MDIDGYLNEMVNPYMAIINGHLPGNPTERGLNCLGRRGAQPRLRRGRCPEAPRATWRWEPKFTVAPRDGAKQRQSSAVFENLLGTIS